MRATKKNSARAFWFHKKTQSFAYLIQVVLMPCIRIPSPALTDWFCCMTDKSFVVVTGRLKRQLRVTRGALMRYLQLNFCLTLVQVLGNTFKGVFLTCGNVASSTTSVNVWRFCSERHGNILRFCCDARAFLT